MTKITDEVRRQVYSEMGSANTPAQQAQRAASIQKATAVRVEKKIVKPCIGAPSCTGGIHRQPCPVYFREKQAERRARQK